MNINKDLLIFIFKKTIRKIDIFGSISI